MLKLAKFLHMLQSDRFNFNIVLKKKKVPVKGCGTIGCAMGWCSVVFPKLVRIEEINSDVNSIHYGLINPDNNISEDYYYTACRIFGMPINHARFLFSPNYGSPVDQKELEKDATPRQVAYRIRKYVAWFSEKLTSHINRDSTILSYRMDV